MKTIKALQQDFCFLNLVAQATANVLTLSFINS